MPNCIVVHPHNLSSLYLRSVKQMWQICLRLLLSTDVVNQYISVNKYFHTPYLLCATTAFVSSLTGTGVVKSSATKESI